MSNTKEVKEYIEPINFQGTKGEWGIFRSAAESSFITNDTQSGYDVAEVFGISANRSGKEREANALLLSNSKELAKSLQNMITLWQDLSPALPMLLHEEKYKEAKEVLNNALNINQ